MPPDWMDSVFSGVKKTSPDWIDSVVAGAQDGALEAYESNNSSTGGFWNWWESHGDDATNFANSIMCTIKPERCQRNSGTSPGGTSQQDNTIMYVLLGVIVLLLIVFMFKK